MTTYKINVVSMYVWPCIIYENDDRYQLDATIVIYYHKYLYAFRASICPSSGVQGVCYCIWCSARLVLFFSAEHRTQLHTTCTPGNNALLMTTN